MSEKICTAKHTKYQPPAEAPLVCPKCGADSNARGQQGFWIDEAAGEADCMLMHVEDLLVCFKCDHSESGRTYAARAAKEAGLVPCPTCKGSGHVQGATKPGGAVIETTEALISMAPDGAGLFILKRPLECPLCHRMATFAVNRDGRTVCVDCDATRRRTP